MRRAALLAMAGLLAAGAAPPNSFTITPPPDFNASVRKPAKPPATPAVPGFTAAPTPNSETAVPTTEASKDPSLTPGFFTRHDQYRGEGISASSSAQAGQDRRAKPAAGLNLTVPLQ